MPGNDALAGGVLDLVLNAGPVAKFVLVLLAVFSIVCWALIVEKWWQFRRVKRETMRFLKNFREGRRFSAVYGIAKKNRESPLAQIYMAAYQEISGSSPYPEVVDHLLDDAEEGFGGERLEAVNRSMRRAATGEIARLERYLPFLATTASSAPFIGLFGTVWGIMESFRAVGVSGAANIAVVAPGIAEALIATAAGLVTAIPAVIGYNYFSHRVKVFATEMDNFTLDFLSLIEKNFVRRQP